MALAVMMKYFSNHLSHQLPEAISTILTVAVWPDWVECSHEHQKSASFINKRKQHLSLNVIKKISCAF